MEQLIIGATIIPYEIKPNANAKSIKITIVRDQVIVSFPPRTNKKSIKKFVESHKDWIDETLKNYHREKGMYPSRNYQDGEEYSFRGKKYLLKIENHEGTTATLRLFRDFIKISLPENVSESDQPRWVKEILIDWYKEEAKKLFKEKLDHYAQLMGCTYNQMRIKNQSTLWGSCSSKSNINLNWRVIMAHDKVIDYLIVHELAHLKHMNHSKEFWNWVAEFIPEFKEERKWLKENGKYLVI